MFALTLDKLNKIYRNQYQALYNVTLNIEHGDFFALLGPNGAGKSSLINIISSLSRKTAGKITVYGYDFDKDRAKVKRLIGVVPQEVDINIFDTPYRILLQNAGFFGMSKKEACFRAEYFLEKFRLSAKSNAIAKNLSGGMKRLLMIARALMHSPKLLVLDEPTVGLDVEMRQIMWDYLRQINEAGTTVLLTTHYFEEAETLCNNFGILNKGKLCKSGLLSKIVDDGSTKEVVLYVKENFYKITSTSYFSVLSQQENRVNIELNEGVSISMLCEKLAEQQIQVNALKFRKSMLENYFINAIDN